MNTITQEAKKANGSKIWVGVKFLQDFSKKDFCCVLTIKFQNFLSAGNFAVNAEMPDRIKAWESGARLL